MDQSRKKFIRTLLIGSVSIPLLIEECSKISPSATSSKATAGSADDLVLTPGGWRPASQVHFIEPGHHVSGKDGVLRKIHTESGRIVEEFGPIPRKTGKRPDLPDNVFVPKEKKRAPYSSGWVAFAEWVNGSSSPINYFSTSWVVPNAPQRGDGQTIFLFNALQNNGFILQPVLQWGPSAAGGGNYWAIGNWYADGSGGVSMHGGLTAVNPGTSLQGIMTLTGQSGSEFSYLSAFAGYPSISYPITDIDELYWAAETLEVYGITHCSDYPNSSLIRFSSIELQAGGTEAPLAWIPVSNATECGQLPVVVNNASPGGEVDIHLSVPSTASGIGGYDLSSAADLAFAFDYSSVGRQDYLVLYRPGGKAIWILQNNGGTFTPIFRSSAGIGGYDLSSGSDLAFAFDYSGSGLQNYIVTYRPGGSAIWILQNTGSNFTPVFRSSVGIGGYNLSSGADRVFPFDYNSSGKMDHLVCYRPGGKVIWILQNNGGTFTPIFQSSNGIGGYDLSSGVDQVFAFDYDGSGKQDHLVLYRPGNSLIYILKNTGGTFSTVFTSTSGIGGYNLSSGADRVMAFDFDGSGKKDHLFLYRPGGEATWILKNSGGAFSAVYANNNTDMNPSGNGIGGFDMSEGVDKALSFDYDHSGISNFLVIIRPGGSLCWIMRNASGLGASGNYYPTGIFGTVYE